MGKREAAFPMVLLVLVLLIILGIKAARSFTGYM